MLRHRLYNQVMKTAYRISQKSAGRLVAIIILGMVSAGPLRSAPAANFFSRLFGLDKKPVLLVARKGGPDQIVFVKASNVDVVLPSQENLVVITHGWNEIRDWPEELASAIYQRAGSDKWLCSWYDWRSKARRVSSVDAARYARDLAGQDLAQSVLDLAPGVKHVHLVGHSAGSWAINSAGRILAKKTDADIHITFLDAYVPSDWQQSDLGAFCSDPNVVYWAEHYFTRDITLKVTQAELSNAHNVDITPVDPLIKDHEFPRYWYYATVTGSYAKGQRYQGWQMYNMAGEIEYGYARCLEHDIAGWQQSRTLKMGNSAVKVTRPKKDPKQHIKEFFEKISNSSGN